MDERKDNLISSVHDDLMSATKGWFRSSNSQKGSNHWNRSVYIKQG